MSRISVSTDAQTALEEKATAHIEVEREGGEEVEVEVRTTATSFIYITHLTSFSNLGAIITIANTAIRNKFPEHLQPSQNRACSLFPSRSSFPLSIFDIQLTCDN